MNAPLVVFIIIWVVSRYVGDAFEEELDQVVFAKRDVTVSMGIFLTP